MIGEKIVVIDDNPKISQSLTMLFPEYEIIAFSDGEKALKYLSQPNVINVVLLDMMMPGMDGMTILSRLKATRSNVRVIMMTAFGSKDIVLEALRNGVDDFLEKPFSRDEAKERISTMLRKICYEQNLKQDKTNQIDRMKQFIERNYQNVSLHAIAQELSLSPRWVSRLFHAKNKTTYRAFKLNIKIKHAKELLIGTRLTVSEISYKLGYQNPETFMRVFKRMTEKTPSEFRLQNVLK